MGSEAVVKKIGSRIIKRYKLRYFTFNTIYKRKGEQNFLRHKIPGVSPETIKIAEDLVILPYLGEPIGYKHDKKWTFNTFVDRKKLIKWLLELEVKLSDAGVRHRDINMSNIVYNGKYTLIDYGWTQTSDESDDETTRHPSLNPFARTDHEAIHKLIELLKY